jgi:hypothetical protein
MSNEPWDRATLEKAMIAVFHYASGLERAKRFPVNVRNRTNIHNEVAALNYLLAFADWAIATLELPNNQPRRKS